MTCRTTLGRPSSFAHPNMCVNFNCYYYKQIIFFLSFSSLVFPSFVCYIAPGRKLSKHSLSFEEPSRFFKKFVGWLPKKGLFHRFGIALFDLTNENVLGCCCFVVFLANTFFRRDVVVVFWIIPILAIFRYYKH